MSGNAVRLNSASLSKLREALLNWYDRNRRDLPWRQDADPYRVWVSEIMLQQTRVAAVLEHYARFLQRFPTVQALAAAREASVLAVWSGLGYYHRARRMHQAAKVIARELKGQFPRTAEEWRELPGIGRYTAAAIASIAFGEAVAVVDGNVERVLGAHVWPNGGQGSRMAEGGGSARSRPTRRLQPGDDGVGCDTLHAASAAMSAVSAEPMVPVSWRRDSTAASSTKAKASLLRAGAQEEMRYFWCGDLPSASLMAGMWELPVISDSERDGHEPLAKLRHSITDTDYDVSVVALLPSQLPSLEAEARWFSRKQWERLPLTGLTRKVLRRLLVESR